MKKRKSKSDRGGKRVTGKSTRYTLAELVAKITPENAHEEIDWGEPVGKEFW